MDNYINDIKNKRLVYESGNHPAPLNAMKRADKYKKFVEKSDNFERDFKKSIIMMFIIMKINMNDLLCQWMSLYFSCKSNNIFLAIIQSYWA